MPVLLAQASSLQGLVIKILCAFKTGLSKGIHNSPHIGSGNRFKPGGIGDTRFATGEEIHMR
jgi:hypothetical protein